ncbi:PTS sugar transporter subunit IIB [Collinsella sp. AGMB00827]|uniref:PTS sugar transporter subunit IIB n=1 Tax=Collinsella ureilytica TaxID=2869515 RepID=A0ABS7MKY5_9ACTN|nr:PTS sugar transporter subunit IIB [Collinsella urealyticum]MBY4797755.1 PTS sugar transporter subunit IIB [Collinsella urealyticum]
MKKILLACGSGICTSTAVNKKVEEMLNSKGFAGQFEITQCKVSEAPAKSANYDFLIATTMAPAGLKCPYVNGIPYLTGVGVDAAEQEIVRLMNE